MAYSRLLLLLIGVISTHLPEVHARPIDFWCKNDSRKKMIEMIAEWADCVTSDTLPSPVQLPCVGFRMTEWTNKTLQQKRAEVLGALQVFEGGVQSVMSQVTLPCQTSLLEKLKNSIRNYLAIVKTLPIQSDDLTPSHSAVMNCSQNSLNKVLGHYRRLLIGKVEHLFVDLQDMCSVEHGTISNQGS
uniref:Thrombopoietin-like n=1 Tax=Acanthochromis polyacanthus TaxID=80966 RepID=A0A3Q1HTX9_9TELE